MKSLFLVKFSLDETVILLRESVANFVAAEIALLVADAYRLMVFAETAE